MRQARLRLRVGAVVLQLQRHAHRPSEQRIRGDLGRTCDEVSFTPAPVALGGNMTAIAVSWLLVSLVTLRWWCTMRRPSRLEPAGPSRRVRFHGANRGLHRA